jgi:uncharacterized protein
MHKLFGKTDLKVYPMGFGGIPIQRNDETAAISIVHEAIDRGINFFDSARGYTDSEHKIGIGIKGFREKIILATKSMSRTSEALEKDINTSLREFGTDYIDLYQCHNVRTVPELETLLGPKGGLEALLKAQKSGKLRYIGITIHKPEMAIKAIDQFPFVSVQFPYNYLEQQNKSELITLAKEKELGIIIMKPLAGGAIRRGDLALRFLLEKDLGVIIPGMDSVEQVRANTELVTNFSSLSPAELVELEQDVAGLGENFCRRCEYCMPCPSGINIPAMFLLEGYHERYNLPEWAIERYAVSDINAGACTECGKCESKCPYALPIREKLKMVHSLLNKS